MSFTLNYNVPRNRQKLSVQLAQVAAVVLDEGESDIVFCDFVDISTTLVGGFVVRSIQANPRPAFVTNYPTSAAQIGALTNLFTGRLSSLCKTPVTADPPV